MLERRTSRALLLFARVEEDVLGDLMVTSQSCNSLQYWVKRGRTIQTEMVLVLFLQGPQRQRVMGKRREQTLKALATCPPRTPTLGISVCGRL